MCNVAHGNTNAQLRYRNIPALTLTSTELYYILTFIQLTPPITIYMQTAIII